MHGVRADERWHSKRVTRRHPACHFGCIARFKLESGVVRNLSRERQRRVAFDLVGIQRVLLSLPEFHHRGEVLPFIPDHPPEKEGEDGVQLVS